MTANGNKQEDFLDEHFSLSQQQLISYKIFWVDRWLNYCWWFGAGSALGLRDEWPILKHEE